MQQVRRERQKELLVIKVKFVGKGKALIVKLGLETPFRPGYQVSNFAGTTLACTLCLHNLTTLPMLSRLSSIASTALSARAGPALCTVMHHRWGCCVSNSNGFGNTPGEAKLPFWDITCFNLINGRELHIDFAAVMPEIDQIR